MEFDSRTAQLCIAGTQAEFARDLDTARSYEALGQRDQAEQHFALASELGVEHYRGT